MTSFMMITGATGGLGSAFAVECARRGYALFLTDIGEEGERLARYLTATFSVEVIYQPCNLVSSQARSEFFGDLQARGMRFWGLINVAGIDYEGAFLDRSRDEILTILNLNVVSTVDVTQAILHLRDQEKRFRLINVSSLAAISPMPFKATYAATKRFLLDFSRAVGEEIRPFGTVTTLCPAGMPTTTATMRAIFAQGFWGKATTVNTDIVARKTINAAMKGRSMVVPGLLNRLLSWVAGLVPVSFSVQLVANRWRTAQEQRCGTWQTFAASQEKAPQRPLVISTVHPGI